MAIAKAAARPDPDVMVARDMVPRLARAILLLAGVGVAMAAGVDAAANHYRAGQPDVALRLRPDDAVALTTREDRRLAELTVTPAEAAHSVAVARMALRSDPLTVTALRQIGVAEALAGRPAASQRAIGLAYHLSRRDLATSILLIDAAISRNEPAAIVLHMDEALTTNPDAADMLMPALAAALFDPTMRTALVPCVRDNRPWIPDFLTRASSVEGATRQTAQLILAAGGLPATPGSDGLNGQILSALANRGEFVVARAYVRQLKADVLQDARFTRATIAPNLGLFAWNFIDRQDLGAQMTETGALRIHAGSDQRGVVATRILMLAPGRYISTQSIDHPAGADAASAEWQLTCLSPSASKPLSASPVAIGRVGTVHQSAFQIPHGCLGQRIDLIASSDDNKGDAELAIDRFGIFVDRGRAAT